MNGFESNAHSGGGRFTTAIIEGRRNARHDVGQLAITSDLSQEPLFIDEQFLHSNSLLSALIKTLCKDLVDGHLF